MSRSLCPNLDLSVFKNARPQPFLDQAEDALVADAMFKKADEPFLAHAVEEFRNIGVDNKVHLRAVDGRRQSVERVMRSPSWPEAVAEAEEVFLVNGVQYVDRGALDDLVLQRRDRQRPSTSVRFGYVDPPARRRPVRSAVNPRMQARELAVEVSLVFLPPHTVDPGGGVLRCRAERLLQSLDGEVMQESGELLLLVAPCGVPYAFQRL